jgi:selenide,water dikinase
MEPDCPTYSDLVLVGGGHAHVHLLKMYGMPEYKDQLAGIRLTLITRDVNTPYSGMLPGFVAGHYTNQECHIDLSKIAAFSGFRLIHACANAITTDGSNGGGYVHLADGRPPVRFDVVSVDVGSSPALNGVPGDTSDLVTPVKPIDSFSTRFDALLARLNSLYAPKPDAAAAADDDDGTGLPPAPFRVVVVGGGAGGIELTLSLQFRLKAELRKLGRPDSLLELSLVNRSSSILQQHNESVRKVFRRILDERGVNVHTSAAALSTSTSSSGNNLLKLSNGTLLPFDECVWCTNASAASWLKSDTPCRTTEDGFLEISDTFQTSVPSIFAAGDCSHNPDSPRPKAGVFAVRAGPPLRDNLLNFLLNRPLVKFQFQKEFLGLISTGDKYSVASRGQHALEGAFLWDLKDQIDRTWMAGYQILPEMEEEEVALPAIVAARGAEAMLAFHAAPMRCGGCGAKVGSSTLSRVLKKLQVRSGSTMIQNDMDDCAICPPPPIPGSSSVHTIDFFRSFISDPFVFGRISAVHALSDCHAMGASTATALALAVCPYSANEEITEDTLLHMLAGACDALQEDECRLVGGHTCEGAELALGFAVNGFLSPGQKVLRKKGGRAGDKIVLTKPIGTGATFASEMRGKCSGTNRQEAIKSMCLSNGAAAVEIVKDEFDCTSCTDVTGFGLMGHLVEMLDEEKGMGAVVSLDKIPFLVGGIEAAEQDIYSSLQKSNSSARRAVINHTEMDKGDVRYPLLFDPQTSGGLLMTCGAAAADQLVARLKEVGYGATAVIGEIVDVGGEAKTSGGGGGDDVCALQKKLVRVDKQ